MNWVTYFVIITYYIFLEHDLMVVAYTLYLWILKLNIYKLNFTNSPTTDNLREITASKNIKGFVLIF